MAKEVKQLIQVAPDFQVKRNKVGVVTESGVSVRKVASAIFDTAGKDSAGVVNTTAGAHGLGVFIPKGSVITRAWTQVKTTFADGASDTATIALSVAGANDLVSAISIAAAGNRWDEGLGGCLPGSPIEGTVAGDTGVLSAARTAATYIGPLSAEKELTATVATHALASGKLILFVEYVAGL